MTFPAFANLLCGVSAVLCMGATPVWILGVPGTTKGDYFKGWTTGFQVLWMYPAAVLTNFAFFFLVRWIAGPGGFNWAGVSGWIGLALLAAAALRMIKALRMMP